MECTPSLLHFQAHGKRKVVAKFDSKPMTSDAGLLLLEEAEPAASCHAEIVGVPKDTCEQRRVNEALADSVSALHCAPRSANRVDAETGLHQFKGGALRFQAIGATCRIAELN